MGAFLELLRRPGGIFVIWLDSHNYTGRLLAGGAPPWLDVSAFVAWQRKAQGLLKGSVSSLPVAPVATAWLEAHPDLRGAMGAKTRSVYPLKTLLADERLREHLVEMASAACARPSQACLRSLCRRRAHGSRWPIGRGTAKSWRWARMKPTPRRFIWPTSCAPSARLGWTRCCCRRPPRTNRTRSRTCTPIRPSTTSLSHYKWDVGLQLSSATAFGAAPADLAFVVASDKVLEGLPHGIALGDAFWDGPERPAIRRRRFPFRGDSRRCDSGAGAQGWPAFPEVVAPGNPQLKEGFRPGTKNCRAESMPAHQRRQMRRAR